MKIKTISIIAALSLAALALAACGKKAEQPAAQSASEKSASAEASSASVEASSASVEASSASAEASSASVEASSASVEASSASVEASSASAEASSASAEASSASVEASSASVEASSASAEASSASAEASSASAEVSSASAEASSASTEASSASAEESSVAENKGMLVGGWEVYNDETTGWATSEAEEAFNKAIEELLGADYSIVSLLGTQVVSGANYEFICKKTVVIPDAKPILCFMTVYKDLDGNAMITNISDLRLGTFYGAESAEDEKPTEKLAGGWSIPEAVQAVNLPEPVAGIYDKVMEEKEGYLPVAYLGSQLVNGTNHAVLCFNESSPCIVYIYAPLSGDPELVNIYNIDMAEASGN